MNTKHKEVWDSCLQIIKDNLPSASFRTWFVPIVPVKLDKNVLTIQVPSPFFYEYLESQYIDILRKTLRRVLGNDAKLEYSVIMDNQPKADDKKPLTVKYPTTNGNSYSNKPVSWPKTTQEHLIKNPFVIPGIRELNVDPQLNPIYSFQNFVEGESNALARSAGYAVAKQPGTTAFNPLLIYGDSGLGKTHLAQAIGIEIKEKYENKVVLYLTADKFKTQFMDATRKNTRNDFVYFYQMVDVLILDDVHELAGRAGTQDVFFHIFNHLHQANKQIILTCDKPPVELQGLEQRLLSRFKWGLSAEVEMPDYETRIKILRQKMYNDGIELSEDIIKYMAQKVNTNVRELEGALISLLAYATLDKRELTMELAKRIIDKLVKHTSKELTVSSIQKVVCNHFNVAEDDIHLKSRKREIVQARQVTMYFTKQHTKLSLASIGAQIGKKDHATVLHACKTVANLMETDKRFKAQIREIETKLKHH